MTDISKKAVAILLLIAIVFSVIGTWISLTSEAKISIQNKENDKELNFKINDNEGIPSGPVDEENKIGIIISK